MSGIVSIDGMYPKAIDKSSFKDEYLPNVISNVRFHSILGFTGVYRWQTYLQPEKFNITQLEKNDAYGENEIQLYRRLVANKFLTKEMRGQIKCLEENMKELKEYEYSEDLPVLQLLTKDTIAEYYNRSEDMKKYATNIVTNTNIQKIKILNGNVNKYLFEEPDIILNAIRNDFVTTYENANI